MKTEERTFYEQWAEQEVLKNRTQREETLLWKVKVLTRLIPPSLRFRTLLDIGCAEGILGSKISQLLTMELAVGIDLSEHFIRQGKEKNKNIQFLQNDGILPFKAKSFDLTICSDFIEHVKDPSKYLDEIRRISRYILFKIPIEDCLIGNILRRLNLSPRIGQGHPSGHLHLFHRGSALEILKRHGFTILHFSFEITPFRILYLGVSKLRIFLNPLTYFGLMTRTIYPKGYLPLWGGNLFAFCKV